MSADDRLEGAGTLDGFNAHRDIAGAPALVVFEDPGDNPNPVPGELLERIARRDGRPRTLVVIRGSVGAALLRGVEDAGGSFEEFVEALRCRLTGSAGGEVTTFGRGLGGYSALVVGVLLRARRIVAVEPVAHLIAEELALYCDRRWERILPALPVPELARRFDASALLDRPDFAGQVLVLFGTQRYNKSEDAVHLNAIHAHRLARSHRVALHPFPDVVEGLLEELDRRGDAEAVLAPYLFDDVARPTFNEGQTALDSDSLQELRKIHYCPQLTLCASKNPKVAHYAAAGAVDATVTRKVDDGWRAWIAENLMSDTSASSILEALVRNGISEHEASAEFHKALLDPYFRASRRLVNRFEKRNWMLATYRKLRRLHPLATEVERRPPLSRDAFLAEYYTANRPVILTGLLDAWPALRSWGLDEFSRRLGDRSLTVRLEPWGIEHTLTMAELAARIRRDIPAEPSSLVALTGSANGAALAPLWDDLGTLTDLLAGPNPRPGLFRLDSAGVVTLDRYDPTNVLMALVVGRLRVSLMPSWDLPIVERYDDLCDERGVSWSASNAPGSLDEPQVLVCDLGPGDVLFRPVGWRHSLAPIETSVTLEYTGLTFDNQFLENFLDLD